MKNMTKKDWTIIAIYFVSGGVFFACQGMLECIKRKKDEDRSSP